MSKYEFDGDKVKKLYGAMQKLGYQQSLGEFEKGFYGKDNYQKRKAVYDVMTENGADLGSSYEDFIGRMRATAPLTTGSKQTSNPERKALFPNSPLERTNYKAKRAAAILDGGGGAFLRDQEVLVDEGYRLVSSKLVPERVEDPKSKRLITKPKKYRVPESDVREGGSMVRMVDAYKTVDGRAVPIPSAATSTHGNENQDEDFATQYISGKINREEYKKKAKAKDSEAAIANSQPTMESDEEFLYRTDKRYKEYRDKILNGDGDIDELSPETKAWYLQRVEARIKDAEERQKKYLSIINSDEHQKKLKENDNGFWREFPQNAASAGAGAVDIEQTKHFLRETDHTNEMNLANAGLGATESELTDLHALRDMLKGKDVGFFRRFKDFFGNRNNLTFGYQEVADNLTLIGNKNRKSALVSSAAESKTKEAEAATMYSRSANLRAKAGSVTAEMMPFIVEIAASGGLSSAASKSVRGIVHAGGKALMKSAFKKGVERSLMKSLGAGAIRWGTRGIEWVAGATAAGAVVATTTGAGETTANITGRMVGHGAQQEDGSYAFEGGEGAVGAVLHGFTSQLIENATEFMGGGLSYGVGKVASKLTKPLAKVGLGGVTDFFGRIAANPISKATSKTLSKFQIQGIPEEIGEEYLGWAGHSMAGDGDAEWSDFADFQKHKELWATMALSVGAMGAFAASGHVPSLLKRRGRSLKMADRAAAGAFSDEEKWNALRDKLDGTDNNNVLRSLYDNVMQDKSLNGRERKAAMLYAGNLLAYRGANLGAIAGKRLALEQKRSNAEDARRAAMVEGVAPSGAESVDEHELDGDDVVSSAFRQGYEETSAANAYMWAKTLEEQEGHAMESLGLSEKELNEKFSPQNAGETLNEIRGAKEGTYTEEQKKAAFDYANTRAAYEGVVERTQDDIDSEIAYHHAIVDRQTNIDSGRLHPVKLFTSEKNKRDDAFLVSGRLAFEYNDKGEPIVSTRLSDPTLIVSDAAGRTRMVSPSEIADAEDAIDVDEYKNTLAGHVRQEMEERKYAEMLKAAEEAQANEVEEGEPESPAVDGLSTSEEEKETPGVNENEEQSTVFGGAFNVGDKFSTEDGEFEVVQLTEGEAPIVQNVETGQQFRPHSEGDLRAAVQSYAPAFIDGAENAEGVTTYNRVAQKETAPQNEAQEGSQQEQEYALSDIISARGERFYADAEGNINLSQIPEKVLNVLELPNVPLRLTESMIEHIVVRHGKELSITSAEQAVRFVVDVMKRFDHVRKGNKKGTFVFSIENGRNKTGRRAVTLVVPEVQTEDTNPSPHVDNSSFLGVVTSGYESIEGLQKREILWEEGASVAPTTETASANVPTPSATQGGMTGGSASNQSISYREDTHSSAGVQEDTDISLENVQSALDKGEIEGITPQMAHDALYNDPDLETEEVDAIVENSRSTAQGNLAKLQKTEIKPRKNESVIAFKKRKAAHAGALAHAEELVRFWEDVQEHRRNLGAQAMQEEENAKQQREAEAAERAKEQAENGLAVAPSWANAEKIVGRPGEFITPNGLRVKGHYVLVESGAAVPSHDARHGFKQSEGFPTDEKGHTLNDRDYERDLDAQRVQREIARNYDARATQQPVVVSPEGFVLSGNGRTMSGDLAAMENTDGAYNSYVREYAEMWGFTSDQVEKLEHPRIVFVSDNPLPLTTETFAAFNAQETKTQSRTEKAVKMGKAVSDEDFAKILRIVTDGHETLSDFYSNANAAAEALNVLETSGVITQQDRANLFDGDVLSDEGRNLLENVLLGKAFEGNPDVVRQLSEVRSLRTSVLNALFYIVENERLNEEFHLSNELSRAINFVYHARKGGGYSFGDKVRTFVQQTELFESTTDVTLDDATVLLLADALNDKRTTLIKSIFKSYNERAEDAGRGQMSLFGDALPSRETLIMETLALLGVDVKYDALSNQVEPSNQATNEQQQEPKQQQQPEAGTNESTSNEGAEGKTETELSSGSVSTSGRGNEGVSTEEEGAKPSDKNAKPSEKSTEKGEKAEDIEVDASAKEESAPLKEEEGINESSRGGSLQDEKEKDKAGYKLTTRQRVVKAKARGGREWIDSLRTTADSHYLRLATDVGYISAPEAQAIIRNSHTKDDVLNLLLRKLEANYFDLYQTDVAEEMARRNLPAEDLQRLYDVVMKDPRAYRFYNALDAIAQNKNTPESVLDELYKRAIKEGRRLDKDGNYVDLGLRLAQNPSTSESHLRTLALTHGEDVAKNPSAPVDLLRVFATEKKSPYGSYYALRAAVAQNPSTPADLLLEILRTSDREEAAVEYAVKHPNLKGTDLERAAELASNPSIFNNPNVTDELLEKWASVKGETKAVKTFAELAQIELDERRTSKEEEGKAHLTKSQRELLELVRNPNATAEELQRAYEGEYYDKDDAKQVKKAKELAKVREEVVRAVAAHPNASSTVLYEIYYSEGEEDPELQRIIESRKDDTIGEDILGSKPKSRIREQRVGTSDIVVGQTVYFKGQPWKVEAISPNGKLTITTEILGHVLRHENILPRWVRLEPVEEKQSDKELSHANNTVSEEQGDTKSARESDSEALNSIESRDKDYADAVARGDIETAERMLAEEAERKGYSLDSPYQGESAFNGKAPSDSGYYENAEERKKAYDEGDYEGAWTLADELVHGVDVGSLVDFRLSDNELRRANDMTRESILNLREALRKARSGEKNITIKMYRSVPPGVKEREFRNGDWITPSRLYALDNAEIHEGYEGENQEGWNGGYRIIEQEVPIEDVWWDGNDVNEWGYDNGEREAYRNTENNRKTFSVTYDSEGNLIPLSKRFDETNSDARYSKGGEQRVSNENALDGVSPEQIELRDGLVDIMRDAGMDVSVSDAEGQRVLDLARGATIEADAVREAREIERVNAVFNDELDAFSEDNANRIIFSLGRPSEVLRAAGVPDMPMKLYGSKLLKKIKKHGFDKVALRDLPRAVANPIAVFNNRKQEGNRAILTELHTEQGNVLVAIDLGKGTDVDFNVVSSVFGKGKNGVVEWINKRQFTYVDEEKALNYLHLAAPIAAASDNQKLSLAANIIKGFENPKLSGENLRQQRKKSITEEMQSIKTKAQSDGTFMLAPNGEPTNLTERQWLQVRTDAFKEWFGDWENDPEEASQMKDENGEPKVFYHNTNADFFAFNPLYNGSSTDAGWLGDGFYFYGDPSEGQDYGEKKMSVFLNIREPYYASEEENRSLSEQNDRSASLKFREERESEGYDGVYFNGDLRQETVVFSPTQIKSATDNVGTFDASKEDIREQRVWHGTPHDFDHFDHSKMGTGEGNQTFGWGTYLTGDKNSGVYYATLRRSSFNPSAPIPIEKSEVLKLGMVLEHRAKVMSAEQALANAIASGTSEHVAVLKEKLEKARKSLRDWVSKVSGDVQAKEKDFKKWREERDKELEYWKENHDAWSAYLMSVEIPDTETHRYLNWSESVPAEELSRINAALEERGYAPLELGEDATGELVYEKLGVGTDKENSEFLHDALDYVGIEYPAGSKMTGYEGGEHNYVIFDESDAKIIDKVKLFRGQHGEVRGFAVGGRIYLDPKMASDETAIHEYTHLWADALRKVNPAEWENVKDLLRGTPIWEETKRLYPELADDEDALADEVLAQFSGKHGAKRLAEAREKAMSEADGVFDKAKVASVFDNVRQALKRFWKGVADFLGLHFTSAEEMADKVLSDLLNGVNPNDIIANIKDSIREQRINKDTREEMQRSVDELRVEVREGYEKAVKDWKYKMQEQWQDSMLALKTLQDELEKKGVKIEEWENAYWAENRMSSMNEEEMKAYTRDYFKPIVAAQIAASKALPQELTDKLNAMDAHLREFDKMDAEEKQRNAVDNYLMLKHGLERNRVLAMRDAIDAQWKNPSEASSVWRAYNEDAGNRENRRLLQEGKRNFEEFLQVDDAIRAHYAGEEYLKNREKDYSGLTSMTTEELTELKDVENAALQLVKEAEDAAGGELSALWGKVNQATHESVEKLYKSGLLTPAAYSQMTTMFQWYVPLRGFAEETSDEVYDYVDQRNGNGMGAVLKGADGRKSKADSPIAHIGSMAERSIVQGNRNLMKQHFYRMVMAHPNDLVSMGEIYLHHNEVTDEWEMMTPTFTPNATPEQIAEETRAFEERMQELVKQEPDNYLRLREHPDVPYRVLGSNLGEHQVLVKVLGRDKLLTVNGDPRVAQAVNGLFNPDAISNDFLKRLRNLNNFLAQMATQRNPEFIFRNLIRDRFYAMEAARVKEGAIDPQYMGRLQKNWISAVGQVVGLTARYNSGTLDMNDAQDRMFYEFMMNGGATGVTRLLNPEEYKGEIADIAKEMQRGKFHYAKVAKLVTKYVDLFGSVSEAITRFATYRTSRELGRSVARSVWDAKEITTNFNKKGAGSKAIRKDDGRWLRMSGETASFFKNFVIFTNANIQGFHNQWQLAKNNPKRFIAHFVAKWVALGFAMPLINNLLAGLFGGDDDHYQDLPETARRNSLCLFVPKVGWVKIPLGFGLRSAYAMGGLLSERLFYPKGDYTSMTRSLFNIALDLMPLSMGSSEQDWWLNVVPSSLRPLAENIANKDWTGRPIVNEYINENWSEYRRANNHTSPVSVYISEGLNYLTGGDEYTPGFVNLNPSQFEHIALGLLSGVGTLVGNTYETTANLVQGEKLDTRHIPFLKDFFSTSGGVTHTSAVKRNFYALKDEYEKTKVRVLGYEREEADGKNDPESVARRVDFRKNSKEYKRYEVMDRAVSEVNRIRRYMKEATTPEEVKKMEIDQQKVMEDAINDVRAIK
nr:MAG TPA: Large polyvalent protein associated domain 38 [Caudoviricetes sp.]